MTDPNFTTQDPWNFDNLLTPQEQAHNRAFHNHAFEQEQVTAAKQNIQVAAQVHVPAEIEAVENGRQSRISVRSAIRSRDSSRHSHATTIQDCNDIDETTCDKCMQKWSKEAQIIANEKLSKQLLEQTPQGKITADLVLIMKGLQSQLDIISDKVRDQLAPQEREVVNEGKGRVISYSQAANILQKSEP
jgi:hypothetical protein